MVVDDDEAIRLRVRDLLEGSGMCEVFEASNGPDGLDAARTGRPDLILLDIMMPGMTGFTVCELLREDKRTREIPIIVLSASDEDCARPSALEVGAEDYLRKPIPSAELKAKVRTIMELNRYHSLTQERRRLRWLVEQSNEALVIIDRKGHLVDANRRARELFALPGLPGCDALAIIGVHYQPEPWDAFERLRDRGFQPGGGFAVVRAENSLLGSHWLQVDLFSDDSDAHGDLLLKFTDRSGTVHRDLQSWSFQQIVSHKLRTPLNGMGSMLELLAGCPGVRNDPEAVELLQTAVESSLRLETTLTSILAYHEALCSPVPSTGSSVSINWAQLLREACAEAGLDDARLQILGPSHLEVAGPLVVPMRQALLEVVENYLKFSRAAADGLTATFEEPSTLRLFAPGRSLPPEAIASLGRPYWQIEPRFSGEIPGMGLGLATARMLLRSLGAGLHFSNNPDISGLVATFSLPPPGP